MIVTHESLEFDVVESSAAVGVAEGEPVEKVGRFSEGRDETLDETEHVQVVPVILVLVPQMRLEHLVQLDVRHFSAGQVENVPQNV